MYKLHLYLLFISLFISNQVSSQNETAKWYFGNNAALDFMTNPPTILNNNTLGNSLASIADAAGSLLFYTDGNTVINQSHTTMANGTGLLNTGIPVIVQSPATANVYYIITNNSNSNSNNLYYSIVDMSLAAGMGSVTVKNATITANSLAGKLAVTKHCNGTDYWILCHDLTGNNFNAFLLTATGINTTAVVSSVGTIYVNAGNDNLGIDGKLIFSPNGKKLCAALCNNNGYTSLYELYDFDSSTGIVSNPVTLLSMTSLFAWECEFSPDGSKLYGIPFYHLNSILQWDLCAGSGTAIATSLYSVTIGTTMIRRGMQLAKDGKIYVARNSQQTLGAIQNPNLAGAACNYIDLAQSISPNTAAQGICYFPSYHFLQKPQLSPFTYTNNGCQIVSFTSPLAPTIPGSCAGTYSLLGTQWDFGDIASGSANISTLANPPHFYTGIGTYTAKLIYYYSCGGGTDTLKQVINITQPCVTVNTSSGSCYGAGSATATANGGGVYTYTWLPTNQTNSVASNLTAGVHTLIVHDINSNFTFTLGTYTITTPPAITVNVSSSSPTACAGSSVTLNANASGGVGGFNYVWQNVSTGNNYTVSQNAGNYTYSVIATDSNTCTASNIINVSFIANPVLTIIPTQSICPTFSATLNASGANTYTWLPNNVISNSISVSPSTQTEYTVTGMSTAGCVSTETTQVFVYPLPTLAINSQSITCASLGSATVTPIGGYGVYNYTWTSVPAQNSSVAVNLNPNTYTVIVHDVNTNCVVDSSVTFSSLIPLTGNLNYQSALFCNSVNTGTAYFSNLSGGSPNQNYVWTNGTSTITNNSSPSNLSAGNWSVTISDALTACQIFSVFSITQPPALTLNVSSSSQSICVNDNFTLTANASGGVNNFSYLWNSVSGQTQITSPSLGTHIFTATATDGNNCSITNTVQVHVVAPPSLTASLSSPSMCAQMFNGSLNTITLTSSGADTYTLQTSTPVSNSTPQNSVTQLGTNSPYSPTGLSTATLLGSNGVCTVSTQVNFSIIPNPTVTINNYTPVICAGQNFTYTSFGANSYTWNASTPNYTTYTSGSIAVTNASINSVFSVVGSSLNCYSPITTSSITVNPIPEVAITPSQTAVCLNSNITLTASGTQGNSYVWQPSSNTGNELYFSADNLQTKTFTVVASLNNCTNSAMASVSVNPLPNAKISISKNGKCVGDSIVLKGNGGVFYSWKIPNGFTYNIQNLHIKTNNQNFSGTYTLIVRDQNLCANTATLNIIINPLPMGNIQAQNFEACVPLCNEFVFVPSSQSTTLMSITWQMNNKKMDGNNINYCFNKAGTYSIQTTIKDKNACANTITKQVIVYPQPIADFDFSPQEPIENVDEVNFHNTSTGAEKYTWNFSIINQTSQEKNLSILFENTGTYAIALVAESDKQCLDTIVKSIFVNTDFTAYVPNVFTPNGDNLNDVFQPITHGSLQYHLQIFNRWGQKLFESKNAQAAWDGTFKGELCKPDVYVWKLIISNSKEERELNGTVMLER